MIVHHKNPLPRFRQIFPAVSHSTFQSAFTLLSSGSEGTVGCRPEQHSNSGFSIRITEAIVSSIMMFAFAELDRHNDITIFYSLKDPKATAIFDDIEIIDIAW